MWYGPANSTFCLRSSLIVYVATTRSAVPESTAFSRSEASTGISR